MNAREAMRWAIAVAAFLPGACAFALDVPDADRVFGEMKTSGVRIFVPSVKKGSGIDNRHSSLPAPYLEIKFAPFCVLQPC